MKIAVLGSGTWGTALSRVLFLQGNELTLYSVFPEEIEALRTTRRHPNLEGMILPEGLELTSDISAACAGKDFIIFAVPSIYVRSTAEIAEPYITETQILADVAKGIEADTLLTMSGVLASVFPKNKIVALSGPTHAEEVACDLPTAIIAACSDADCAKKVADLFRGSCIRAYIHTDILGVELGGALKNIMALAAGISSGLGYGDNAKAALITRGIAEIKRLGKAMGCMDQTFFGLAGVGDLIVTAMSRHSRNNRCGILIGQGLSVEEAKKEVGMVVEGLNALEAAIKLQKKYDVFMPVVHGMDLVVNRGVSPKVVVDEMMNRPAKIEIE